MNVRSQDHGEAALDPAARQPSARPEAGKPVEGIRLLAGGPEGGRDAGWRRFDLGFRDERHTAAVIASGPSVARVPAPILARWPAIAVNDAYRLAPGAEAIYAADGRWWDTHHQAVTESGYQGRRFTADARTAHNLGLEHRQVALLEGLSTDPRVLRAGGPVGNSGAQAINLAYHAGARRLLLFGFDMAKEGETEHFFGDHAKPLRNDSNYARFISGMWKLAMDMHDARVEVLNCCATSRLGFWKKLTAPEVEALCSA